MNLEKAIKYPFEDQNWIKKLGIVFGIYFVVGLVSSILGLASDFISIALQDGLNSASSTDVYRQIAPYAIDGGIDLATAVIMFPLSLYVMGYGYVIVKNIMNNKSEELPEHNSFVETAKLALGVFVTTLPTVIISGIPILTSLVLFAVAANVGSDGAAVISLVIAAIFILIGIILGIVLTITLQNAQTNIYLLKGSLKEAFNFQLIKEFVMKGSLDYLILTGLKFVVGLVVGFIGFITCCVGFVTIPLLQTLTLTITAYIAGETYKSVGMKVNSTPVVTV